MSARNAHDANYFLPRPRRGADACVRLRRQERDYPI